MSTVSVGDLLVKYKADVSDLTSKVKSVKSELSSVSSNAEQSGKSLKKTGEGAKEAGFGFGEMIKHALAFAAVDEGLATVGGALGFLKEQTLDVIGVTEKHAFVAAQTVQVLKSTKDVSGETTASLNDMADALSQTTDFSHDTIQGGENLLLTFTNIGKGVFPQATQSILDVSQAMGQDLKSSAIQVGKALGDPLTGMTALQRIGVTFSATEKEQIKTMMAHHDVIGAQKVILKELGTEFGGSAQAAGKTFGGMMKGLSNTMEDVKIKIGTAVMPLLTRLGQWFIANGMPLITNFSTILTTKLIPGFVNLITIGSNVVNFFKQNELAMDGLKAVLAGVSIVIAVALVSAFIAWATAAWAAATATIAATWPILLIGAIVAAVVFGIILAVQHWGQITQWLGNLWATVSGWIGDRFSWLGDHVHGIINAIGGLFSWIGAQFSKLGSFFHAVGQAIGGVFSWIGGLIHDEILGWEMLFSWIGDRFSSLGSFFQTIAGAIGAAFSGLGSLISGVWNGIVGDIRQAINWIISMINGFIGGIDSIGIDIGPVHIHPNIPQIPYLASGGYIESTGLAMVHAGESVVPARASSGGVGGTQTFILEVDSVQLAQVNARATDRIVRLKLGAGGRAP